MGTVLFVPFFEKVGQTEPSPMSPFGSLVVIGEVVEDAEGAVKLFCED